ncbi:glycine-rich cell wall structural protein-like [Amphibalanus amphitrite]|uniref:glycine-rich cell wall structural protein-like n=1 Tax=Amphibalanus amphitrite TaxID=1232801 RepID=UPI001C8FDD19|nr:glycine-rich cell wall structural protein-like [Amphibalanus amphitrite]
MKTFVTLCLLAALVAVVTCRPEQQAAAELTPDAGQPVAEAGDLQGAETGIFGQVLGSLLGGGLGRGLGGGGLGRGLGGGLGRGLGGGLGRGLGGLGGLGRGLGTGALVGR